MHVDFSAHFMMYTILHDDCTLHVYKVRVVGNTSLINLSTPTALSLHGITVPGVSCIFFTFHVAA